MEIVEEKPLERGKKYVVPENYLESEVENRRGLVNRLRSDEREQKMLDEIYEEIVVVLNRGLVEKSERRGRKRQPWFTKEIAALRREFHKAEGVWLRSRNADDQKVQRKK